LKEQLTDASAIAAPHTITSAAHSKSPARIIPRVFFIVLSPHPATSTISTRMVFSSVFHSKQLVPSRQGKTLMTEKSRPR
jgi:hypothetical protein